MTRGECKSNTLFVAIRGEKSDGHQFVDQAIEQGATVIVAEREMRRRARPASWSTIAALALADLGGSVLRPAGSAN